MTLFVLVLFDLTAVGDTADHDMSLSRLEQWVGIKDTALEWFRFYLADQTFCVILSHYLSSSALILCGVPQGSVSVLLLFCLHYISLGSILKKHSISFSCCAHCSQIYFPYTRLLNKFPILASLLWLPEHFRIHFKKKFVFKALSSLPLPYLSELLHPHTPTLWSADQLLLSAPKTKRKLRVDSTFTVIPIDLPLHIKQVILSVSSLNLFLLFDLMFLTLFILSLVILMYGCYFVMWCIFYLLHLRRRLRFWWH